MTGEGQPHAEIHGSARLEDAHTRLRQGIEQIGILVERVVLDQSIADSETLIAHLLRQVRALGWFDSQGVLLRRDDPVFEMGPCLPESSRVSLQLDSDALIEHGSLAWALNQNRPVQVSRPGNQGSLVLCGLATRSRVIGMLVCTLAAGRDLHSLDLQVLAVMCSLSACVQESKERHEEIRRQNAGLEDQIRHRNRELEVARDVAMAAANAKSRFQANTGPELRTLLNGMLGMLEILSGTNLTPEQLDYVETGRHAGQSLLSLINDALDFSVAEAGKRQLDRKAFDLRELVEGVLETVALHAHEKGLGVGCFIDDTLEGGVIGDSNCLRQVLVNLLGNAVKFTSRGNIFVNVVRLESMPGQRRVRFEISDTGCGIPAEAQATIFDSFSKADAAVSARFGVTGLGLAICRQLVALMDGEIGVQSEPGFGSLFYFSTCFDDADEVQAFRPDPRLQGRRVLIAGDDGMQRMGLQQMLRRFGVAYDLAASPELSVQSLRAARADGKPFDAVLIDVQMPLSGMLPYMKQLMTESAQLSEHLVLLLPFGLPPGRELLTQFGLTRSVARPVRQSRLHEVLLEILCGVMPARMSGPPAGQRPLRVLVAEDNEVNQKVVGGLLRRLGYAFDIVPDGAQAVTAAGSGLYDLVLMDCQMPVMDGYAATQEIRRRAATTAHPRRLPILAMTANALAGDRERCLASGMDDYLTKPIDVGVLQHHINAWATSATLGVQAPISSPPSPTAQAPVNGHEALDPQRLAKLRQEMGDLFGELVQVYVTDVPRRLVAIREASGAGDAVALRTAAHTLKGASSNVGALRLSLLCAQLEKQAVSGPPAERDAMLAAIEAECHVVIDAFQALLDNRPQPQSGVAG